MELEYLPPDVISLLGEHFFGTVEPVGLRRVPVITRETAQMTQSSKHFQTLAVSAWGTLSDQTPALFHQFEINVILETHGCLHFLGQQPLQGPVNRLNGFVVRDHFTYSPGLQVLSWLEQECLERTLCKSDGPLAPPLPLQAGLEGVHAPLQVKLTLAIEKCQRWWRIPSPSYTRVTWIGIRQLEPIDRIRELVKERPDIGLFLDKALSSLLSKTDADWPHLQHGNNSWWSFRKLICNRWSPAEIHQRQQTRRKAAVICLHCLRPADP